MAFLAGVKVFGNIFLLDRVLFKNLKTIQYGKLIIPHRGNPDYCLGYWLSWISCIRPNPHFISHSHYCYFIESNKGRSLT